MDRSESSGKTTNSEALVTSHILLRVKTEDGKTIKAHKEIVDKKGLVLLGKLGRALSVASIKTLNDQIAGGTDTYLFLTTREGWNGPYVTYQCLIRGVDSQLDESQLFLVPKYYSSDYKNIKTWFKISSIDKMSKERMNQIYVLSSGRSIMSVVKSSATTFLVGLKSSP